MPFLYSLNYILLIILIFFININLAHDAVHNAVFKSKKINQVIFTICFQLMGSTSYVWWKNHITHHRVPNVIGLDNDIIETPLLRLNQYQKRRKFHKFQFLYAPILYFIHLPINYFIDEPYKLIFNRFNIKMSFWSRLKYLFFKILHFLFLVWLPSIVTGASFSFILVLFIIGLALNSMLLVLVIGIPHINQTVNFYNYGKAGTAYSWSEIQVDSSCNFNSKGKVAHLMWGGFNNHILHHLLPEVCHTHYYYLTDILQNAANEFNLKIRESSFLGIIYSHFRMLYALGRELPIPQV